MEKNERIKQGKRKEVAIPCVVLVVGAKGKFIMNYWVDIFCAVVVSLSHLQDIFSSTAIPFLVSVSLPELNRSLHMASYSRVRRRNFIRTRFAMSFKGRTKKDVRTFMFGLSFASTRRTHKFGLFIVFLAEKKGKNSRFFRRVREMGRAR